MITIITPIVLLLLSAYVFFSGALQLTRLLEKIHLHLHKQSFVLAFPCILPGVLIVSLMITSGAPELAILIGIYTYIMLLSLILGFGLLQHDEILYETLTHQTKLAILAPLFFFLTTFDGVVTGLEGIALLFILIIYFVVGFKPNLSDLKQILFNLHLISWKKLLAILLGILSLVIGTYSFVHLIGQLVSTFDISMILVVLMVVAILSLPLFHLKLKENKIVLKTIPPQNLIATAGVSLLLYTTISAVITGGIELSGTLSGITMLYLGVSWFLLIFLHLIRKVRRFEGLLLFLIGISFLTYLVPIL